MVQKDGESGTLRTVNTLLIKGQAPFRLSLREGAFYHQTVLLIQPQPRVIARQIFHF